MGVRVGGGKAQEAEPAAPSRTFSPEKCGRVAWRLVQHQLSSPGLAFSWKVN